MIFLTLSLVALFLGPAIARASRGRDPLLAGLDGFVLVGVGGLAFVHIFPEALELAGAWVVVSAVAGFLLPGLLEHRFVREEEAPTQGWVVVLVLAGLAVHAMLDGAALGLHEVGHAGHAHGGGGGDGLFLALGVVLHRLPLGVAIWGAAAAIWGSRRGLVPLVVIGLATVVGFVLGEAGLTGLPSEAIGHFQGLVGGSLLHVMVGHPIPAITPSRPRPAAASAGAVTAVAGLAMLPGGHAEPAAIGALDAGQTFVTLALASAPWFLLAVLGAGVIVSLGARVDPARLRGRSRPSGALGGLLIGTTQPVCSCGVGPTYAALQAQGMPLAAGLAFLVAAPELSLDAVLVSWALLGPELTLARVGAAAGVALVVALVVGRARADGDPTPRRPAVPEAPRPAWGARARYGARYALGELVDHMGPWMLAGLVAAAVVEPRVGDAVFADLAPVVGVVAAALAGLPAYVCASGATPFVAVLLHKGLSPGAAAAFLITGPAVNAVTARVLARVAGRGAATGFAVAVVAAAVGAGLVIDALAVEGGIALHAEAGRAPSALEVGSLVVLAALLTRSLFRQGPRGFVAQVTAQLGSGRHTHDHDHDHDHG